MENSQNSQNARRDVITRRFKDALVKYLDDHNMTQTQLARNAGVSRAIVANIIADRVPSFETAVVLSRAMGLNLDEIERGRIVDVVDPEQFKELFKKDVMNELQKALNDSDVYGKDMTELTNEQKETIMRLIRAYLNINKDGSKRKK